MKRFFLTTAFLLATAISVPALSQTADATAKAKEAAIKWLELTDSGKYSNSWDQAAAIFQNAISSGKWAEALQSVRAPLGATKSRTLKSANFTKTLPGAPAGEYVVVQFATDFANKKDATETITPVKEKDGTWRVSGYFIK